MSAASVKFGFTLFVSQTRKSKSGQRVEPGRQRGGQTMAATANVIVWGTCSKVNMSQKL